MTKVQFTVAYLFFAAAFTSYVLADDNIRKVERGALAPRVVPVPPAPRLVPPPPPVSPPTVINISDNNRLQSLWVRVNISPIAVPQISTANVKPHIRMAGKRVAKTAKLEKQPGGQVNENKVQSERLSGDAGRYAAW